MSYIRPELGVYWRDRKTIQVGLDPRTGVVLDGLTRNERDFVEGLTRELSPDEINNRARAFGIAAPRVQSILSMLHRAGVGTIAVPEITRCVRIATLDQLGVAIGLGLARAGVPIRFRDATRVTQLDHPALTVSGLDIRRDDAMLTAIRAQVPRARTHGIETLVVVTGSRLIPPEATGTLCDDLPHLLAWVEEYDTCIGPLVEPGRTPCAGCISLTHSDIEEEWPFLALQAMHAPPLVARPEIRDLAAALATHTIVGFLRGYGNTLANSQWKIGANLEHIYRAEVSHHHSCGCLPHAFLTRAMHAL